MCSAYPFHKIRMQFAGRGRLPKRFNREILVSILDVFPQAIPTSFTEGPAISTTSLPSANHGIEEAIADEHSADVADMVPPPIFYLVSRSDVFVLSLLGNIENVG